jgi:hypothetical protein
MRKEAEQLSIDEEERIRMEAEQLALAEAERLRNINHYVIDLIEKMTKQEIKHKYIDLLYPKPPALNQTYYDGS